MVRKSKKPNKKFQRPVEAGARGELYEIEWLDAYEESAGWHSIEEALRMKTKPVLSVGYLIWQDPDQIILASDIDPKALELLKEAQTKEELLLQLKKLDLDGSDCGRLQVIPGQWAKSLKQVF